MKSFLVDQDGYYGEFGGAYVPEILHKCVEELTEYVPRSARERRLQERVRPVVA